MTAGSEAVGTAYYESAEDSDDPSPKTSTLAVVVAQATPDSNMELEAAISDAPENAAPTGALQQQTAAVQEVEATSQTAPRSPEKTKGSIAGSETSETADEAAAIGDSELKTADSTTVETPEKTDGHGATNTAPVAETNASALDVNTQTSAIATTKATAEVPRQSIFGPENTIQGLVHRFEVKCSLLCLTLSMQLPP